MAEYEEMFEKLKKAAVERSKRKRKEFEEKIDSAVSGINEKINTKHRKMKDERKKIIEREKKKGQQEEFEIQKIYEGFRKAAAHLKVLIDGSKKQLADIECDKRTCAEMYQISCVKFSKEEEANWKGFKEESLKKLEQTRNRLKQAAKEGVTDKIRNLLQQIIQSEE